jgi:hypothetical protein
METAAVAPPLDVICCRIVVVALIVAQNGDTADVDQLTAILDQNRTKIHVVASLLHLLCRHQMVKSGWIS